MSKRTSTFVVFDESGHDPTYADISGANILVVSHRPYTEKDKESTVLMESDIGQRFDSDFIGDFEETGRVNHIYSLPKMMAELKKAGLLKNCEVDKRGQS